MGSRISYNIHGQFVADHDKLINHLRKIKPASVLVMDGLGLAREIKANLPDTVVINRIYPDDDIQNRMSPADWLKQRAPQAEGGIFQYTSNEAGFSTNLINWHIQLMELAIKSKTPLVIGNMSVGTPEATDWAAGRRILELCDQHRDLFIMGLHEYACGVIVSGFLGGWPENAGVAPIPANAGKGKNLIPVANWPTPMDAAQMTMFHCGRFKFLIQYCKSIGLKPPRIILTEHGFDDVSDIKGWSERLHMTPPYTTIRGWKSSINQWRDWYNNVPGWSPQRAMFEQLAYADRTLYQNSAVESQLLFCWANDQSNWSQFDLSNADEFQGYLENYALQTPAPPPVPVPVPVPPPPPPPIIIPPVPVPSPDLDTIAKLVILRAKIHGLASLMESIASEIQQLELDIAAKKAA